jgi:hypothetical protein
MRLLGVECGVESVALDQVLVAALLGDSSVLEDIDPIGLAHRA